MPLDIFGPVVKVIVIVSHPFVVLENVGLSNKIPVDNNEFGIKAPVICDEPIPIVLIKACSLVLF